MLWIRGLFILFLWTLAKAQAQDIFYGSFANLEVQANPGFQNAQQFDVPKSIYDYAHGYTYTATNPCQV